MSKEDHRSLRASSPQSEGDDQQEEEALKKAMDIIQEQTAAIKDIGNQLQYAEIEQARLRRVAILYQEASKYFINIALKYGRHEPNCNLLSLQQAGRIMDESDEELCSCSWSDHKQAIIKAKGEHENE